MKDTVTIAVDVMGGDNPPSEIISGCADALKKDSSFKLILIGDMNTLQEEVKKQSIDMSRTELVGSKDDIEMAESPVMAIRKKKESSIVLGMKMLKEKKADGFISAGNTGAVLAGGQLIVGRIRGIDRSPLAIIIPSIKGEVLLLDCGANVDAKPVNMLQFARMGSIYMSEVTGRKNPKVGLVNIGAEKEKGNALVKESFPLLEECKDINFAGSVEARNIPYGEVDVAVCEAFVGNVILKTMEGLAKVILTKAKESMLSTTTGKIGALMIKKPLKKGLKAFDIKEYGGAPMLGLNGLVMKAHGNSDANAISNTVLQAVRLCKNDIVAKMESII